MPPQERAARGQGPDPTATTVGENVVIDLTDATVARHGGARLDATGVSVAAPAVPRSTATWRGRLASPLGLLLVLNALNVVDAALTVLWIDLGIAREANPVVEAIGFPAKVVGVAVLSYAGYLLRPRALLVPIVVLGLVVAYHLIGATVVVLPVGL